MSAPRLVIRKAMMDVGGKQRPVIQVQAVFEPALQARLNDLFGTEVLFKRAVYAQGFPEGTPLPSPAMAPALNAFLKNDACPEVTVKTLLAGQKLQTNSLWDIVAFEYIAKRSFDNLCEFAATVAELGTETVYRGSTAADFVAFTADAISDAA
jgi:hypothetical protein